jgi:Sulfatase
MIAPSLLPASRTSWPVHSWEADPLPYRPREILEEKRNAASSDPCCFRTSIAVLFLRACRTNPRANKKPNILVIFGDDIGQTNISAYGKGVVGYTTPNIDRIAKEGMLFTDYYAENSCAAGPIRQKPSRGPQRVSAYGPRF